MPPATISIPASGATPISASGDQSAGYLWNVIGISATQINPVNSVEMKPDGCDLQTGSVNGSAKNQPSWRDWGLRPTELAAPPCQPAPKEIDTMIAPDVQMGHQGRYVASRSAQLTPVTPDVADQKPEQCVVQDPQLFESLSCAASHSAKFAVASDDSPKYNLDEDRVEANTHEFGTSHIVFRVGGRFSMLGLWTPF